MPTKKLRKKARLPPVAPAPELHLPGTDIYDCAVVGAGPSGLLSALYLRRFRRSVLIFNTGDPRAFWIPKIHNLVGIEKPTSGRKILGNLQKQLGELGTSVICENVRVDRDRDFFWIRSETAEWRARRVILATGVKDNSPDFANLTELRLKAVLGYCPICDGYDHCGKQVGLLAAGSESLSKIQFLCGYTDQLHVILLKNFKISPYHQSLIKKRRLKIYRDKIAGIEATSEPKGLEIRFKKAKPLRLDFAYVSMGVQVNDQAFKHLKSLKRTAEGFLTVDSVQQTSVKGMYAVGDCVNDLFQVSVAAGHAAIASTDVHNSLDF